MNIGKVVGSVVCTVKTPTLEGIKLLVVRQIVNGQEKGLIIACDGTRQAGIGDVVYMIGRKEAALMLDLKDPPPLCGAGPYATFITRSPCWRWSPPPDGRDRPCRSRGFCCS